MNRLILEPLKPRNPWVAASLFRLAGAHRRTSGGQRRQAERRLRRELRELDRERHSP